MQSSHTWHVNKSTTLTVRRVTLRSAYCRIMFFSARRHERLGRGTGGTTGCTTGTATAARARLQWQNVVHCHCLTPRVIDVWPRRWRLLVSVDDKGVVAGMSFRCTLRSRPPGFLLRRQGTQQTAWSGWTTPTGSFLEGGTASVVLVAIRGRRLWYDVGGVGG